MASVQQKVGAINRRPKVAAMRSRAYHRHVKTMTETSGSAAPADAGRTTYLVLGMHRSGTSAVTQLLSLAGARLPRNLMPGDEHNARGYFEPWRIANFNDERLRAAGSARGDGF